MDPASTSLSSASGQMVPSCSTPTIPQLRQSLKQKVQDLFTFFERSDNYISPPKHLYSLRQKTLVYWKVPLSTRAVRSKSDPVHLLSDEDENWLMIESGIETFGEVENRKITRVGNLKKEELGSILSYDSSSCSADKFYFQTRVPPPLDSEAVWLYRLPFEDEMKEMEFQSIDEHQFGYGCMPKTAMYLNLLAEALGCGFIVRECKTWDLKGRDYYKIVHQHDWNCGYQGNRCWHPLSPQDRYKVHHQTATESHWLEIRYPYEPDNLRGAFDKLPDLWGAGTHLLMGYPYVKFSDFDPSEELKENAMPVQMMGADRLLLLIEIYEAIYKSFRIMLLDGYAFSEEMSRILEAHPDESDPERKQSFVNLVRVIYPLIDTSFRDVCFFGKLVKFITTKRIPSVEERILRHLKLMGYKLQHERSTEGSEAADSTLPAA